MTTPNPHRGALLASCPASDIHKPHGGAWNLKHVDIFKSTTVTFDGHDAFKIHSDKGAGTTQPPECKAVGGIGINGVPHGLPKSSGGTVIAFDAFWPQGYQWARGGKIAGTSIGPGKASAGRHNADGASNRIMWQHDGGAILYIYVPTGSHQPNPIIASQQNHDYGIGAFNAEFAGALKTGKWNHLEIGTKLNTFAPDGKPNADGEASLTINGVTHTLQNIVWRLKPEYRMNDAYISQFFGGPDVSPVDQDMYIANFEVYDWA